MRGMIGGRALLGMAEHLARSESDGWGPKRLVLGQMNDRYAAVASFALPNLTPRGGRLVPADSASMQDSLASLDDLVGDHPCFYRRDADRLRYTRCRQYSLHPLSASCWVCGKVQQRRTARPRHLQPVFKGKFVR